MVKIEVCKRRPKGSAGPGLGVVLDPRVGLRVVCCGSKFRVPPTLIPWFQWIKIRTDIACLCCGADEVGSTCCHHGWLHACHPGKLIAGGVLEAFLQRKRENSSVKIIDFFGI